jgi:hypothetical protein
MLIMAIIIITHSSANQLFHSSQASPSRDAYLALAAETRVRLEWHRGVPVSGPDKRLCCHLSSSLLQSPTPPFHSSHLCFGPGGRLSKLLRTKPDASDLLDRLSLPPTHATCCPLLDQNLPSLLDGVRPIGCGVQYAGQFGHSAQPKGKPNAIVGGCIMAECLDWGLAEARFWRMV